MDKKSRLNQTIENDPNSIPKVIIKFHNEVKLPYVDNLEKYLVENDLAPWEDLFSKFPGISIQRIYISLSPERVQELEDRAFAKRPTSERPNLLKFFMIVSPPDTDLQALVEAIKEWKIIQLAYIPFSLETPTDLPSRPALLQSRQIHLAPAPESIGAEAAWLTPSADGRNMQFIDLERGWVLGHENFLATRANPNSSVFSILEPATSQLSTIGELMAHGSSVLGTVAAPDIGGTTIGIAFKASGRVVSINRIPTGEAINNALLTAVAQLNEGDVLLIEAQAKDLSTLTLWPVEVNLLEYQEIRTAVHLNIIVIEPAGNGRENSALEAHGNDLGMFTIPGADPDTVVHILDRGRPAEFRDSGAILVGSGSHADPHFRMTKTLDNSESNFGNRIDCYAWGQEIKTTGGPNQNDYEHSFGSTSGASAMIAGAALIVQGLAKAHLKGDNPTNRTFLPETLRGILGSFDPLTRQPWRRPAPDDHPPYGTKSKDPLVDLIGVMPDLIKIIDKKLGLGPDIFLRDFLGDTGDPHARSISSSPDVIVKNARVRNYNIVLGHGSPNQNLNKLGEKVVKNGNAKYIYVRVTNRGRTPAQNVQVTVYWSELATLRTAGMWRMIGSNTIASIPAGEMRVCEILWRDTRTNPVPPAGSYCFVGMAGNTRDPAPSNPATFASWNNYYSFVRQFNNVTRCNFTCS